MKLSALPAHAFRTPAHKRCLSFTFPRDLICFTILTVHWTLSYFLTGWMSHNSPYPSHVSASIAFYRLPLPLPHARASVHTASTHFAGRQSCRLLSHLCTRMYAPLFYWHFDEKLWWALQHPTQSHQAVVSAAAAAPQGALKLGHTLYITLQFGAEQGNNKPGEGVKNLHLVTDYVCSRTPV